MNSTPAASSAARMAASVRGMISSPRSNLEIVSTATPASRAKSLTPHPTAARAILLCIALIVTAILTWLNSSAELARL
jgi:hypothetical protein